MKFIGINVALALALGILLILLGVFWPHDTSYDVDNFKNIEGFEFGAIDVVYLYVNGTVPGFLEGVEKAIDLLEELVGIAYDRPNTAQRYRDNDEFLFSLRSVYKNLRLNYRHIYVVLPSIAHLPFWMRLSTVSIYDSYSLGYVPFCSYYQMHREILDRSFAPELFQFDERCSIEGHNLESVLFRDNSRNITHTIRVVTHDAIFYQKRALPTFNSRAIELNMFRIPELSEHYLYLNDDFFLLRAVTLKDFIDVQKVNQTTYRVDYKFYLDDRIKAENNFSKHMYNYLHGSTEYTNSLLNERYNNHVPRSYFRHVPRLLNKNIQAIINDIWSRELNQTSMHKLRYPKDVHSLFLYFQFVIEECNHDPEGYLPMHKEANVRYRFTLVSEIESILASNYISFGSNRLPFVFSFIYAYVSPLLKFVCVNDDAPEADNISKWLLSSFYNIFFSQPSPFELHDPSCI